MDENGKKKLNNLKKWLGKHRVEQEIASQEEYGNFIDESLNEKGSNTKWLRIGQTNENTQQRLKDIYGKPVSNISINNGAIRHILNKKHHNMTPETLGRIVDEINSAAKIEPSENEKQDYDIALINKDNNDRMNVVAEIHLKNDYLAPITAFYKTKEAMERPDAARKSPPELTSKTGLHSASNTNIPQSPHDVKGKNDKGGDNEHSK